MEAAIAPMEVQRRTITEQLLCPKQAVPGRPLVQLTLAEIPRVEYGNEIPARPELVFETREVVLCDPDGVMIALGDFDDARRTLTPRVVLRPPASTYTRSVARSERDSP